jgi:hypothetical protein
MSDEMIDLKTVRDAKAAWPVKAFDRAFYERTAIGVADITRSMAKMSKMQGPPPDGFLPGFVVGTAVGAAETARVFELSDADFETVLKDVVAIARLHWRESKVGASPTPPK